MKKQIREQHPSKITSRSRYLTREQAESILDFLINEELPEHDSPYKLYFNGKLIGSASQPKIQLNKTENENN